VIDEESGYSLVEMVTVMAILSVVLGGIVTLFTAGIKAEADQNARFQGQQDTRLALDKVRKDVHAACTVSTPATYNTWASSVTLYFRADNCASGSSTVTWCTSASGTTWILYRVPASSCTGSLVKVASSLTGANIFAYIPPNSHLVTSSSVGTGTGAIASQDAAFSLPRLHVDLTVRKTGATHSYRLVDDIAFRNGPRTCSGAATC
jgi:prepilin-type N-terminal cleavage/methylation domain-containing protein